MTTAYYKSARNYARPQSAAPVHVPQPFLNYGGLTQMLNIQLLFQQHILEYHNKEQCQLGKDSNKTRKCK